MKVATDNELISAWLELQARERDSPAFEELFWSEVELSRLAREDPGRCWRLIAAIVKRAPSQRAMESLASGALEEFLGSHGDEFIDTVEKHAQHDSTFALLLGGVWQGEMPEAIWQRVRAAASKSW